MRHRGRSGGLVSRWSERGQAEREGAERQEKHMPPPPPPPPLSSLPLSLFLSLQTEKLTRVKRLEPPIGAGHGKGPAVGGESGADAASCCHFGRKSAEGKTTTKAAECQSREEEEEETI